MKGIIFDLLEQVVSKEHGEEAWDGVLDAAGVSGAYTAVGSYDDEELTKLVVAASEALDTDPDDLVRWFGRECIPLLAERFSAFFTPHQDTHTFLLTLNEVIHPEVRKLFPGAYAPSFEFQDQPGSLTLAYNSHRNLCFFAEGLIEGAALHYGDDVGVSQSSCTKRGDDRCVLVATFEGAAAATA